jgi:hypothetical protein
MLSREELVELYRDLRGEKVLSVYLDGKTNDFSERHLWRRRLEHNVSETRRAVNGRAPEDTDGFGKAYSRVKEALQEYDQFLPDRGWVGFATPNRLVYGTAVRVPMPDLIRWEEGIRVAPYVRALKQDRLVVAVILDSRRARIFKYRDGTVGEPENLMAETFLGDLTDMNVSKRASSHSGVRGKTGTDAAQRFLGVGSERMMKELMDRVVDRTGDGGLLLVGGTPEAISAAVHHLPQSFGRRTLERPTLRLEMSDSEVRDEIENGASELNQRMQSELLDEVVDQARSGGRGALGPDSVEKALREGRVDTLLISRNFIRANPDYADHLVGAAFQHHGEVEELSSDGADRLDSEGEGLAARLRYTL